MKQAKHLLLSIILAVSIGISLLGAVSASASLSAVGARQPAQPDQVTITFWHNYKGQKETDLTNLIAEFESAYPTITVDLVGQNSSGDLFNNLMERIKSGGETPEVVVGYPNQMWNYARFDALRFLDDFVAQPQGGLDLSDFHTAALDDNRLAEYQGQLGGLPMNLIATRLLYYNEDILTSQGITVPLTWDDFYTACMSATTGTVSGTIIRPNGTQFLNLLWTHGGTAYSPDLKFAVFNSQPGRDALQLYRDLLDQGYARMADGSYEDTARFAEGQVAFVVSSSSSIPFIRADIENHGQVNSWGVTRLPADPGSEAVFVASSNIMILRSTPEEENAAWLLLNWITAREQDARRAALMGQYPARISSSTHPSITQKLAADLQYAQAYAQLGQHGRNQIVLLGLGDILGEMQNAVELVLHEGQPVTDTLDTAAANVTGILALTGPDAATITPAGGTLVYTNTQGLASTTVFPPGAVAETTTFAYVPIQDLPSDSLSFALIPNMAFSQPVTVTVQYRDQDIIGMQESQLHFYNYNWANNAWENADPCGGYIRDTQNNRLTASVCHFSDHALFDWLFQRYLPHIAK